MQITTFYALAIGVLHTTIVIANPLKGISQNPLGSNTPGLAEEIPCLSAGTQCGGDSSCCSGVCLMESGSRSLSGSCAPACQANEGKSKN